MAKQSKKKISANKRGKMEKKPRAMDKIVLSTLKHNFLNQYGL